MNATRKDIHLMDNTLLDTILKTFFDSNLTFKIDIRCIHDLPCFLFLRLEHTVEGTAHRSNYKPYVQHIYAFS